jgi:pimeloyl-ACP methyl ester carboxylesterase
MKRKALAVMTMALSFAWVAAAQAAPAPKQHSNSNRSNSSQVKHGSGHHVTIRNGEKIYYTVAGHGQPLILIHGYPLNGNMFMYQRKGLSNHFKVITPDLPGFGKSEAKSHHATLKAYARDMFDMMDKLGIKKAIIGGHSMGGMTVIEMYKMHPNRFKGMILMDTAAVNAPIPRKKLWMVYAELGKKKNKGKVAKTLKKLLTPDMLSDHTRANHKNKVHEYQKMLTEASLKGVIGGGEALADRPNNRDVLGKIKVPTLIFVGSEDTITPKEFEKHMHHHIRNSKLVVLDGASHASIFEKPHQANQAIINMFGQGQNNSQTAR